MFTISTTSSERKGNMTSRSDKRAIVFTRLSLGIAGAVLYVAAGILIAPMTVQAWSTEAGAYQQGTLTQASLSTHASSQVQQTKKLTWTSNAASETLPLVYVQPLPTVKGQKVKEEQERPHVAVAAAKLTFTAAELAPQQERIIRSVKVVATGYTAGAESTGKEPGHPEYGITYSGVKVRRDYVSTIAADLSVFPLGSILYIPGYGYGIVTDIGAKIKGKKLDLFFHTTKQVYGQWGKKEVEVKLIKRGNGKVSEQMLDDLNAAVFKNKGIPESML
ncbi:3D domain-containing protein [Paenibacillus alvei]|uniref:3D domain-containing protein n=1 Tax=Paenibacillus alvei TaxID=44250 RepID=A0ABT4E3M4_PAEAL|nr:3D domain-containing protein [Paenibacillus alvei]MCY9528334.1 3D domain-containing protein [Paenibacillus alvei]